MGPFMTVHSRTQGGVSVSGLPPSCHTRALHIKHALQMQ
uniref:Uncharacterized protein n=1 Tax=Anguilla anguilla TaxID=7936 RepID=A0A0E9UA68_ANGAN